MSNWISVKDKLPNAVLKKVLVSMEDKDGLPLCAQVALWNGYTKMFEVEDGFEVTAWMPLPAPYIREDKNE